MPTAKLAPSPSANKIRFRSLETSEGASREDVLEAKDDLVLHSPPPPALLSATNDVRARTSQPQDSPSKAGQVVRLRSTGESWTRHLQLLQRFEGIVTDVSHDGFWADIFDATDRKNPREHVDIPISEISKADRYLVVPGSVFYWSIGIETRATGQIYRVSEIRFRRTPVWSVAMIAAINDRAEKLLMEMKEHQRK